MRVPSARTRLARLGYREPEQAEACLTELADAWHGLAEDAARTADPDTALQMLVRLVRIAAQKILARHAVVVCVAHRIDFIHP